MTLGFRFNLLTNIDIYSYLALYIHFVKHCFRFDLYGQNFGRHYYLSRSLQTQEAGRSHWCVLNRYGSWWYHRVHFQHHFAHHYHLQETQCSSQTLCLSAVHLFLLHSVVFRDACLYSDYCDCSTMHKEKWYRNYASIFQNNFYQKTLDLTSKLVINSAYLLCFIFVDLCKLWTSSIFIWWFFVWGGWSIRSSVFWWPCWRRSVFSISGVGIWPITATSKNAL